jgi:hypothetical protein
MYGLSAKLFCITVDNAANNKTVAIEISRHLLGCAGHQFNLAAQAALKALEYQSEPLISNEIKTKEKQNFLSFPGKEIC